MTPPAGVHDPGPRGGPAAAGAALAGLTAAEQGVFTDAAEAFNEIDSVSGGIEGEEGTGLGPTFNSTGCAQCHAFPAAGGTSPAINPQVADATRDGATNLLPSFIKANGPVRELRLIAQSSANNAPLDGGVTGLFTIKGRTDAPGCNLAQPNFAAQLAANNASFRIPTPTFGLGLVENTSDLTLRANLAANAAAKNALGISGHLNTSGNDGTVTRFGWKAQNKSLLVFAGEAYNVEQGVSNEVFTNERAAVAGCVFNATPEDGVSTSAGLSDVVSFANFMRFSAPPSPADPTPSTTNGSNQFANVGCANCHSPTLTTAASPFGGMSSVSYHPYSDFAVHHLGSTLADGVNQGNAGPGDFRSAPLWGVGQRLFFLHDGRTSDLYQAIQAHTSPGNTCVTTQNYQQFNANGVWFQPFTQTQICASEANAVVANFNALSATNQQDVLNFLRSL
ncbi:MAG TPA: di-heme oxidoredictase family protein [Polyangia bacterium]